MTKEQIENEYPFKGLEDGWIGLFAPDNGVINVQLLLRTLYRLAQDYGARAHQYTAVTRIEPHSDHGKHRWAVHGKKSGSGEVIYYGEKIIITCGAYSNHVVTPSFNIKLNLDIWEMVANYFSVNAGPNGTVFPSK